MHSDSKAPSFFLLFLERYLSYFDRTSREIYIRAHIEINKACESRNNFLSLTKNLQENVKNFECADHIEIRQSSKDKGRITLFKSIRHFYFRFSCEANGGLFYSNCVFSLPL